MEPVRQKDKPLANSPKLGPVKGFRDFSGKEAERREEIRRTIVGTFEKYGFEPAETPVIESEEFVKQGNPSDEVISDIFKLQDKGKRKLALRYEFTFQLKGGGGISNVRIKGSRTGLFSGVNQRQAQDSGSSPSAMWIVLVAVLRRRQRS